jgi:tRNA A-37 threonylcarbamoyl transferase component Bud32
MGDSIFPTDPATRDPRFQKLESEWRLLLERYLPHREDRDPFYCYNRALADCDPPQGWKLHVSATLLSACEVFAAVAPVLLPSGVRFKALVSMLALKRANCGSFHGYRQIGKFVTVFARSEAEALALAEALDRATQGMIGPRVPSDLPYRPDGIVFYRYGAFRPLRADSERNDTLLTPEGELVPDLREPGRAVPEWVKNPFTPVAEVTESIPVNFGFMPLETISLRGKGAVYRALDLRQSPARLVVLKEGIRWGEVDLDLRDGYSRLADELAALAALSALGVAVPQVLAQFQSGDRLYALFEHIAGEPVQTLLMASSEPLDLTLALGICIQAARLLSQMHSHGWAWRDCKPQNLIRGDDGLVRAVDFEDAIRFDAPLRLPAGTTSYLPPEWPDPDGLVAQDLYALGVTLHQTLSRSIGYSIEAPLEHYRGDVPREIRDLVSELLSPDRRHRPSADIVVRILERFSPPVRTSTLSPVPPPAISATR